MMLEEIQISWSLLKMTNQESISLFQEKVMSWWKENKRDLPWRNEPTPYVVLISEIMLQQTQVSRVIPKFIEFLTEFPSLECLAAADNKHLLSVWSGLGYNRRALWLKEAAKQIVEIGGFPTTVEELRNLKGIGPYTSRSILIFAFNEDVAAVDTNIRRVLIASGFATEEMTLRELQEVADRLLFRGQSSDWHNALMDYGSSVLTSSSTGITPLSKQPKFQGSSRQLRGALIRLLTCSTGLDLGEISNHLKSLTSDQGKILVVLEQLIQENIIECDASKRFMITS
jgi:A/G-specific adenine glycosylase